MTGKVKEGGPPGAVEAPCADAGPNSPRSPVGGAPGASGKLHFAEEPDAPWQMPAPTTVSNTPDGHPQGRHMIDAYRMMGAAARVSGGKYQKQMAEVYEMAALCIENEAKRADRAEELLAAMGSNPVAARERSEHSSPPFSSGRNKT